MKVRNFYPRQVLRKLQGEHKKLDEGQVAALRYVMLKGRKLGYSVMSGPTASAEDLLAATSKEAAQAIFANCTTRIVLHPAV